jgi:hypothetical protein
LGRVMVDVPPNDFALLLSVHPDRDIQMTIIAQITDTSFIIHHLVLGFLVFVAYMPSILPDPP